MKIPTIYPIYPAPFCKNNQQSRLSFSASVVAKPDTVAISAHPPMSDLYQTMQTRWIRDAERSGLLAAHEAVNGFYLGTLPCEMLNGFGSTRSAYQKLDTLANLLTRRLSIHLSTRYLKTIQALRNEEISDSAIKALLEPFERRKTPVKITFLNNGGDGDIYKLTVGQNAYVLKVCNQDNPLKEFQINTFLSAQGAINAMRSYACHYGPITRQRNWMLSEFINQDRPFTKAEWAARGHTSISEVARKHSLLLHGTNDTVNSVLVDPQDAVHQDDAHTLDPDFAQIQLETLDYKLGETLIHAREK